MKPLTPKMQAALDYANKVGMVAAGYNEHAGKGRRIAASTIRALIARGLLSHCYSSEGGYAGRPVSVCGHCGATYTGRVCVSLACEARRDERSKS